MINASHGGKTWVKVSALPTICWQTTFSYNLNKNQNPSRTPLPSSRRVCASTPLQMIRRVLPLRPTCKRRSTASTRPCKTFRTRTTRRKSREGALADDDRHSATHPQPCGRSGVGHQQRTATVRTCSRKFRSSCSKSTASRRTRTSTVRRCSTAATAGFQARNNAFLNVTANTALATNGSVATTNGINYGFLAATRYRRQRELPDDLGRRQSQARGSAERRHDRRHDRTASHQHRRFDRRSRNVRRQRDR